MLPQLKRRREGKTDYKARLNMLRSGLLRLVVRKTNRYIITQIVSSKEAQDFVLCTANSYELLKYGWPREARGSLKSVAAAYLTGIFLANKFRKLKLNGKKFILDIGLIRSTKSSRVYAVVKGALETGLQIPCSQEMLPSEQRLYARHLKKSVPVGDIKNKIIQNLE